MSSLDSVLTEDGLTAPRAELRRGVVAALPVMIGFVPFALVLGAQAVAKGFSPVDVPLMTGLNFGGGSEFAALGAWTTPVNVALIVAITALVNCRHLLMGAALAPWMRGLPKRVALPALFLMCDESWAMSLADAKRRATGFSLPYYLGVGLGLHASWLVFTALGALLGPVLGDVTVYGFDMAFAAVFLVMLRGMWKGVKAARPWMVSLAVSVTIYLLVPGAWYIAAGALSGVVAAYAFAEPCR